jgi:hypothetical protein
MPLAAGNHKDYLLQMIHPCSFGQNIFSSITYGITKIQLLPVSKYMMYHIFNSPEKA